MKRFLALMVFGIAAGVLLAPVAVLADFGIDPGKVFVDNLFPGAKADYKITIYNKNNYETAFVLKVRKPDYTETGYEPLPYLDWVTITPDRITIGAMKQSDVTVTVSMPEDAVYSGKKAETWISFMEQETEGTVKIEIASRLLISTRVEEETEPAPEAINAPPTEGTEPTKPSEATVQPAVEGGGEVGITAEPGEAQAVSPEVEPGFPWVVVGPVLGLIAVVGIVFFLRWARQRT
jgi:hypothetical protein